MTFQSKLRYLQGQLHNIQDPVQNESAGAQKVRRSAIKGTIFYHSCLCYAIPILNANIRALTNKEITDMTQFVFHCLYMNKYCVLT